MRRAAASKRAKGSLRPKMDTRFVTADPAFMGEMTLTATFAEVFCWPPGPRAEDSEAGARLSLEQLARPFER